MNRCNGEGNGQVLLQFAFHFKNSPDHIRLLCSSTLHDNDTAQTFQV